MILLAIDSSSTPAQLALQNSGEFFFKSLSGRHRQNETLMPNIDSLFKEHNISANKLKAVACIRGPGSFTGLRIGLSIAKALALALDIPLYTENGLMLQALEAENRGLPVLSLIPAREKSYYALLIKNGQEQIERKIYSSQEIISIGKN